MIIILVTIVKRIALIYELKFLVSYVDKFTISFSLT